MENIQNERRKYSRFDTELRIRFQVKYDFKTKVKFRILESRQESDGVHKYSGICKNINVEGLSFTSHKETHEGDLILLEVYAPNAKEPVKMEGQVRWSRKLPGRAEGKDIFQAGVLLISVNGKLVAESVYFDEEYKVMWSEVLSILLGNFKSIAKQLKKKIQ